MSVPIVRPVINTQNVSRDKKIPKVSINPVKKLPQVQNPQGINDILLNSFTLNDLKYGLGKIITPKKNVLSIISKAIHTDTATLTSKMGNIDALQTAYTNAQFSMGVGFICSGMGALLRLGTNISDMYHQHYDKYHHVHKHHHADDPLSETAQAEHKLHRRVNQTADILSSIGGLVTVKNMVHALRTPNVIPQALTAFGGGVTASAASVTAIQAGVGLLAAGVTISSLKTLLNVAKDVIGTKKTDKSTDISTDRPSTQSLLLLAAEQFSRGIGTIILLKNPAGFSMSNLLNWDNNRMFIKPLEWFNAGSFMVGGTMALKNVIKPVAKVLA